MPKLMPAEFHYGALALAVVDLERSLDYYQRRIGMQLIERAGDHAVLGAGGRRLLELEERRGAERDPNAADLFHFALVLPSRTALGRQLAHLVASDTPLTGASDHAVSEALYLRDPDGHGIELYRDRPRETWHVDGRLRMTTNALDLDGLLAAGRSLREPWDGLDPATRIAHLHLETLDLEKSKRFYVDRLGLEVTAERSGATFMSVGGYHHHLAVNTWGGKTRPAEPEGDHIGMLWFEIEVPAPAVSVLAEEFAEAAPRDGRVAVRDPNGLEIRFVGRA